MWYVVVVVEVYQFVWIGIWVIVQVQWFGQGFEVFVGGVEGLFQCIVQWEIEYVDIGIGWLGMFGDGCCVVVEGFVEYEYVWVFGVDVFDEFMLLWVWQLVDGVDVQCVYVLCGLLQVGVDQVIYYCWIVLVEVGQFGQVVVED